ncbi:MAG: ABC-type transport auxiliary lipoprotein family protein [Limisphaerales bacterium]
MKRTILCAAICLLTGCLARPRLDKQSFIFAPPSPPVAKAASGSRVLAIRSLQVAAPFDGRSFVYRTGEYSYDRDPYAGFMTPPEEALVASIGSWFREAGGFSAVVEANSALKPNTLVEIQVAQLYGDFRPSQQPAAVLDMRFAFFDGSNGVPGMVILQREYSRGIPLKARTAAALIEGWNQALVQILDSVMLDFYRADANAPKP